MPINEDLENYVQARADLALVVEQKKKLEQEVEQLSESIIGYMDTNAIATMISDAGYRISKDVKRYADIQDEESLYDWAEREGNDYVDDRWTLLNKTHKMKGVKHGVFIQQPNRRLCKVIIDHYAFQAETTGQDLNDLLPPGLGMKGTAHLRMLKPKQDKSSMTVPAETLLEMARRGAAEKETE